MSDPETLLRQHFSAVADEVPLDANLVAGVDGLRRTRRHRRLLGGGAALAAAVVAAAIAVPLAVAGHHQGVTSVSTQPGRAVPSEPPPGERAVTWAGIQLYVPATWLSGGGSGGTQACAQYDHPGGVVVYLSDVPETLEKCQPAARPVLEQLELGIGSAVSAPTYGELGGFPAVYTHTTIRGQLVTSVQVPSRGAFFTITTNTQARASAILATAHRVSADENGCAVDQPPSLKKVAGGGAGGPQVIGTPVSGVVCSYSGGRLVMGVTLDARDLAALTADLNRLPARYTTAELAVQQAPHAFAEGGLASIMLTDADGSKQQITVRGPLPGVRPGVAGATQSTLTQELFFEMGSVLPSGFGGAAVQTGSLPSG